MKSEIKTTVSSIITILLDNNEKFWIKELEILSPQLDINYVDTLHELRKLFGGAGSFTDLVLHKDGWPLKAENDELFELRTKLYKQIKDELQNHTSCE